MEEEAWRRDKLNIRKEETVDQFEEVVPKEYWGFRETVFVRGHLGSCLVSSEGLFY